MNQELTKTVCEDCGKLWLGAFFGVSKCNECAFQKLGDDDVLGVGDAPEEDEKESLPLSEDDEIDAMVESESKEYVNAH
jgi:hypothetical protein